ncbi:hypothetical protein [Bradyrhizobium sp. LMG 9283]|uniref:hypothetical protein n=1 Tax=Bradyrhizobium sp. LMG 9283 TaxID=592064 RepID=UPI00388F67A5
MLKSIDPILPHDLLRLLVSMGVATVATRIAAATLLASPDPAAGHEPWRGPSALS